MTGYSPQQHLLRLQSIQSQSMKKGRDPRNFFNKATESKEATLSTTVHQCIVSPASHEMRAKCTRTPSISLGCYFLFALLIFALCFLLPSRVTSSNNNNSSSYTNGLVRHTMRLPVPFSATTSTGLSALEALDWSWADRVPHNLHLSLVTVPAYVEKCEFLQTVLSLRRFLPLLAFAEASAVPLIGVDEGKDGGPKHSRTNNKIGVREVNANTKVDELIMRELNKIISELPTTTSDPNPHSAFEQTELRKHQLRNNADRISGVNAFAGARSAATENGKRGGEKIHQEHHHHLQTVQKFISHEAVAHTLALKAGKKHKDVFYGYPQSSDPASVGVSGIGAEESGGSDKGKRATTRRKSDDPFAKLLTPLSYLNNHLINTKQTMVGVLSLWHDTLKPHLIESMTKVREDVRPYQALFHDVAAISKPHVKGPHNSLSSNLSSSYRGSDRASTDDNSGDTSSFASSLASIQTYLSALPQFSSPIAALSCIHFDGARYTEVGSEAEEKENKEGEGGGEKKKKRIAEKQYHHPSFPLILSTYPEGIFPNHPSRSACPLITKNYHKNRGAIQPISTQIAATNELLTDVAAVALFLTEESDHVLDSFEDLALAEEDLVRSADSNDVGFEGGAASGMEMRMREKGKEEGSNGKEEADLSQTNTKKKAAAVEGVLNAILEVFGGAIGGGGGEAAGMGVAAAVAADVDGKKVEEKINQIVVAGEQENAAADKREMVVPNDDRTVNSGSSSSGSSEALAEKTKDRLRARLRLKAKESEKKGAGAPPKSSSENKRDSAHSEVGRGALIPKSARPLPSTIRKANAFAAQILYWVLGAEDYAVGRGRIAQEALLLEVLQEEAGEGPQYNRLQSFPLLQLASSSGSGSRNTTGSSSGSSKNMPSSTSSSFIYPPSPPRASSPFSTIYSRSPMATPRAHPQMTSFRADGSDGFNLIVPKITLDHIDATVANSFGFSSPTLEELQQSRRINNNNENNNQGQGVGGRSVREEKRAGLTTEEEVFTLMANANAFFVKLATERFSPSVMPYFEDTPIGSSAGESLKALLPLPLIDRSNGVLARGHHAVNDLIFVPYFLEEEGAKKVDGGSNPRAHESPIVNARVFKLLDVGDGRLKVTSLLESIKSDPHQQQRSVSTVSNALLFGTTAGGSPLTPRTQTMPIPFGSTREEGRVALERYYSAKWNALSLTSTLVAAVEAERNGPYSLSPSSLASLLTKEGDVASPSTKSLPSLLGSLAASIGRRRRLRRYQICAPIAVTSPKCFALNDGDAIENSGRTGRDPLIQTISGEENMRRQVPIVLEKEGVINIVPFGSGNKHLRKKEDNQQSEKQLSTQKPPVIRGDRTSTRQITAYSPASVKRAGQNAAMVKRSPVARIESLISSVHNERQRDITSKVEFVQTLSSSSSSSRGSVSKSSSPQGHRELVVMGDFDLYKPFLDPTSPHYRRILCATYTYHKNFDRAVQYHRNGGNKCDKHLLFTDKPVPEEKLALLDRGRFVVMALNTPMGEDYMNMWQKTRLILEKIEFVVRGFAEHAAEEGINNPDKQIDRTKSKDYAGQNSPPNTSPPRPYLSTHHQRTGANHQIVAKSEEVADIASQLKPEFAGYDHVLLSGDDVCLVLPKIRRYIAEVEDAYGVSTPAAGLPLLSDGQHSDQCGKQKSSIFLSKSAMWTTRSATVPHHIGYSHRKFISGATYIINRQAYNTFMSGPWSTCSSTSRTFAEDVLMGNCHRTVGTEVRNTGSYGLNEEVMTCVNNEYMTGMTHTIHQTSWMNEYKRRVVPRGGVVTSVDSAQEHFCDPDRMRSTNINVFGLRYSSFDKVVTAPAGALPSEDSVQTISRRRMERKWVGKSVRRVGRLRLSQGAHTFAARSVSSATKKNLTDSVEF